MYYKDHVVKGDSLWYIISNSTLFTQFLVYAMHCDKYFTNI